MRSPRRRLWPVALISSALLLLTVGAIAIGQLYWSGLHSGMARMRVSIEQASRRQVMLAEQVRAAEARLSEREAELDRREAALEAQAGRERGDGAGQHGQAERSAAGVAAPAAGSGAPPATLDGIDWRFVHGLLAGITRDVATLPPPTRRAPHGSRSGARLQALNSHRALKAQMQVADAALELGDPVLLDLTAAAAQRLLFDLYAGGDARAQDVARQLGQVRAALRVAERRLR